MSIVRSDPPWDFFHDASTSSLQSFELSRLNNAANLRRQVTVLLDQWVNDNSQALLSRWLREHRALPPATQRHPAEDLLQCVPAPFEPPSAQLLDPPVVLATVAVAASVATLAAIAAPAPAPAPVRVAVQTPTPALASTRPPSPRSNSVPARPRPQS